LRDFKNIKIKSNKEVIKGNVMKLYYYIIIFVMLTGCDNKNTENSIGLITNNNKQSNFKSQNNIVGYKGLKFGMSFDDVLKSKECTKKREAYYTLVNWVNAINDNNYDGEKDKYPRRFNYPTDYAAKQHNRDPIRIYKEIKSENFKHDLINNYLDYRKNAKSEIHIYYEVRGLFMNTNSGSLEGVNQDTEMLIRETFSNLDSFCETSFAGTQRDLIFNFDDKNHLREIIIEIGAYEPTLESKLITDLADKYGITALPTEEQIAKFNANPLLADPVYTIFADGQIYLSASRYIKIGYVSSELKQTIKHLQKQGAINKDDL
jgi:hypothetical protein